MTWDVIFQFFQVCSLVWMSPKVFSRVCRFQSFPGLQQIDFGMVKSRENPQKSSYLITLRETSRHVGPVFGCEGRNWRLLDSTVFQDLLRLFDSKKYWKKPMFFRQIKNQNFSDNAGVDTLYFDATGTILAFFLNCRLLYNFWNKATLNVFLFWRHNCQFLDWNLALNTSSIQLVL